MTIHQTQGFELAVPSSGFAPATNGMSLDNRFYSLEAQAGRPAALILVGGLPAAEAMAPIAAFGRRSADFLAHEADIVVLIDLQSPNARDFAVTKLDGVRAVYSDPEIFRGWGFGAGAPALAIIDRAGRVVATSSLNEEAVDAALGCIAALPREDARDDLLPAPALFVPGIFSPDLCRELIAHFEASAHTFGGMASIDSRGEYVHKVDESKKHRHDLVLGPKDHYLNVVLARIIARCVPEIRKAFNVDIRHTDRVLIARYDETGGYFMRHRDNAAPSVAFRQFALSVNLNDDYEGGNLLFPEYNSHRYRPGAGAGVVFSCSLLHEATRITRGRRYVVLTFLHDVAAQARWFAASAGALRS